MNIQRNVSLKKYNTFGIDVTAKEFVSIANEAELVEVLSDKKQPLLVISGGSNMLLTKAINTLVVHINTKGILVNRFDSYALVTAKAGENWHDFVQFCIDENLGGLENLSLIPGCVGSAPIQNIGAYGVELKDCFVSCKAVHRKSIKEKIFTKEDCQFGYRNSVFKNEAKDQYIITEVTFKLSVGSHTLNTKYGAIEKELVEKKRIKPTIKDVSEAVIAIRKSKLPDPKKIGNSGSFFKNPIITVEKYQQLMAIFPEMPHYPISNELVKVPAGWLIDQVGFKGYVYKNAGVHGKQALVLINRTGSATGKEIWELAMIIQKKIKSVYKIELEAEVNVF
ncbi:UDP-N-acetylmuramate dehydrogenase [Aquimarina agarivorans]|uniref:UDP-N-acetylmuramate dehydrogenase n=1 Tax=Aquimarina agarivorans TaxID=980584 RepID=UPI000248E843|nr:UDP-N-acetylmuramate dehydrogenase [Aquimarina agarivorans]